MKKTLYSLRNYKKELIFGPLFKVIEVIFELLIPFLMKYMIDVGIESANNGEGLNKIIMPGVIILCFVIVGFCSTLVCQHLASIASQGFGTDLRNRIYQKVCRLSLDDIEKFNKGNLVNLITNDSNRIQLGVALLIRLVIRAPVLVIGSLICSFIINVEIGFIFLAIVPLVSIILGLILYFSGKQYLKVQSKVDKMTGYSNDSLKGSRVIRALNKQDIVIQNYKEYNFEYFKESKTANIIAAFINPLTFLIVNIAIILVIYFGGDFVLNSKLDDGDLVALISYLNQILMALIVVSNLVINFTRALSSKKRVDALLTYNPTIKNNPIVENYKVNKGDELIRFKDVSFKYLDGENNVIEKINLTINKGEFVGIIGGTGSGKTTLIKLIERFVDTSEGELFFKGQNIKDYDLKTLRDNISLVNQKSVLFNGTIKSNLLMGKKDATDEEITKALIDSEAYSFVKEYNDYINHEVLEGGKNFSGGQKQRLSLARSLLKDSELLILDDSTSALDYLTDKKVRENILKRKDITLIIVSQRATSLINADKIIVVDNGKIDSIGKHEELLNKSKIYKEVYDSQTLAKVE